MPDAARPDRLLEPVLADLGGVRSAAARIGGRLDRHAALRAHGQLGSKERARLAQQAHGRRPGRAGAAVGEAELVQ